MLKYIYILSENVPCSDARFMRLVVVTGQDSKAQTALRAAACTYDVRPGYMLRTYIGSLVTSNLGAAFFDFTSLLSTTAAGGRVIVIAFCVPAWRPLACLSFDPRAWKVALRASRSEFRDLRAALGACSTAKSSYGACKVVGGASHRERWSSTFDGAVVVGCCAQDYSALRDRHLTPRHTTRLVCCH